MKTREVIMHSNLKGENEENVLIKRNNVLKQPPKLKNKEIVNNPKGLVM